MTGPLTGGALSRLLNTMNYQQLLQALELDQINLDTEAIQKLEPVTAFIAGYAVGMAEGTEQADFDRAQTAALNYIRRLLEH